jgi:Secretion system C-terminal sorting domain
LFIGTKGKKYAFYSIAVDSVGNPETKIAASEVTITFTPNAVAEVTPQMIGLQVYPNPAQTWLFVKAKTDLQKLEVLDIMGRLVKTFTRREDNRYDISGLANGLYVLQIKTRSGDVRTRILVLR